jgi:hypothetical protein
MKTRMNTIDNRIDQSVKPLLENTPMINFKNYIPSFPISNVEELKSALVKRFSAEYAGVATRLVFQAVNEAYALVSLTSEPLLLLPALAEEKVQSAAVWSARQHSLPWLHPLALVA